MENCEFKWTLSPRANLCHAEVSARRTVVKCRFVAGGRRPRVSTSLNANNSNNSFGEIRDVSASGEYSAEEIPERKTGLTPRQLKDLEKKEQKEQLQKFKQEQKLLKLQQKKELKEEKEMKALEQKVQYQKFKEEQKLLKIQAMQGEVDRKARKRKMFEEKKKMSAKKKEDKRRQKEEATRVEWDKVWLERNQRIQKTQQEAIARSLSKSKKKLYKVKNEEDKLAVKELDLRRIIHFDRFGSPDRDRAEAELKKVVKKREENNEAFLKALDKQDKLVVKSGKTPSAEEKESELEKMKARVISEKQKKFFSDIKKETDGVREEMQTVKAQGPSDRAYIPLDKDSERRRKLLREEKLMKWTAKTFGGHKEDTQLKEAKIDLLRKLRIPETSPSELSFDRVPSSAEIDPNKPSSETAAKTLQDSLKYQALWHQKERQVMEKIKDRAAKGEFTEEAIAVADELAAYEATKVSLKDKRTIMRMQPKVAQLKWYYIEKEPDIYHKCFPHDFISLYAQSQELKAYNAAMSVVEHTINRRLADDWINSHPESTLDAIASYTSEPMPLEDTKPKEYKRKRPSWLDEFITSSESEEVLINSTLLQSYNNFVTSPLSTDSARERSWRDRSLEDSDDERRSSLEIASEVSTTSKDTASGSSSTLTPRQRMKQIWKNKIKKSRGAADTESKTDTPPVLKRALSYSDALKKGLPEFADDTKSSLSTDITSDKPSQDTLEQTPVAPKQSSSESSAETAKTDTDGEAPTKKMSYSEALKKGISKNSSETSLSKVAAASSSQDITPAQTESAGSAAIRKARVIVVKPADAASTVSSYSTSMEPEEDIIDGEKENEASAAKVVTPRVIMVKPAPASTETSADEKDIPVSPKSKRAALEAALSSHDSATSKESSAVEEDVLVSPKSKRAALEAALSSHDSVTSKETSADEKDLHVSPESKRAALEAALLSHDSVTSKESSAVEEDVLVSPKSKRAALEAALSSHDSVTSKETSADEKDLHVSPESKRAALEAALLSHDSVASKESSAVEEDVLVSPKSKRAALEAALSSHDSVTSKETSADEKDLHVSPESKRAALEAALLSHDSVTSKESSAVEEDVLVSPKSKQAALEAALSSHDSVTSKETSAVESDLPLSPESKRAALRAALLSHHSGTSKMSPDESDVAVSPESKQAALEAALLSHDSATKVSSHSTSLKPEEDMINSEKEKEALTAKVVTPRVIMVQPASASTETSSVANDLPVSPKSKRAALEAALSSHDSAPKETTAVEKDLHVSPESKRAALEAALLSHDSATSKETSAVEKDLPVSPESKQAALEAALLSHDSVTSKEKSAVEKDLPVSPKSKRAALEAALSSHDSATSKASSYSTSVKPEDMIDGEKDNETPAKVVTPRVIMVQPASASTETSADEKDLPVSPKSKRAALEAALSSHDSGTSKDTSAVEKGLPGSPKSKRAALEVALSSHDSATTKEVSADEKDVPVSPESKRAALEAALSSHDSALSKASSHSASMKPEGDKVDSEKENEAPTAKVVKPRLIMVQPACASTETSADENDVAGSPESKRAALEAALSSHDSAASKKQTDDVPPKGVSQTGKTSEASRSAETSSVEEDSAKDKSKDLKMDAAPEEAGSDKVKSEGFSQSLRDVSPAQSSRKSLKQLFKKGRKLNSDKPDRAVEEMAEVKISTDDTRKSGSKKRLKLHRPKWGKKGKPKSDTDSNKNIDPRINNEDNEHMEDPELRELEASCDTSGSDKSKKSGGLKAKIKKIFKIGTKAKDQENHDKKIKDSRNQAEQADKTPSSDEKELPVTEFSQLAWDMSKPESEESFKGKANMYGAITSESDEDDKSHTSSHVYTESKCETTTEKAVEKKDKKQNDDKQSTSSQDDNIDAIFKMDKEQMKVQDKYKLQDKPGAVNISEPTKQKGRRKKKTKRLEDDEVLTDAKRETSGDKVSKIKREDQVKTISTKKKNMLREEPIEDDITPITDSDGKKASAQELRNASTQSGIKTSDMAIKKKKHKAKKAKKDQDKDEVDESIDPNQTLVKGPEQMKTASDGNEVEDRDKTNADDDKNETRERRRKIRKDKSIHSEKVESEPKTVTTFKKDRGICFTFTDEPDFEEEIEENAEDFERTPEQEPTQHDDKNMLGDQIQNEKKQVTTFKRDKAVCFSFTDEPDFEEEIADVTDKQPEEEPMKEKIKKNSRENEAEKKHTANQLDTVAYDDGDVVLGVPEGKTKKTSADDVSGGTESTTNQSITKDNSSPNDGMKTLENKIQKRKKRTKTTKKDESIETEDKLIDPNVTMVEEKGRVIINSDNGKVQNKERTSAAKKPRNRRRKEESIECDKKMTKDSEPVCPADLDDTKLLSVCTESQEWKTNLDNGEVQNKERTSAANKPRHRRRKEESIEGERNKCEPKTVTTFKTDKAVCYSFTDEPDFEEPIEENLDASEIRPADNSRAEQVKKSKRDKYDKKKLKDLEPDSAAYQDVITDLKPIQETEPKRTKKDKVEVTKTETYVEDPQTLCHNTGGSQVKSHLLGSTQREIRPIKESESDIQHWHEESPKFVDSQQKKEKIRRKGKVREELAVEESTPEYKHGNGDNIHADETVTKHRDQKPSSLPSAKHGDRPKEKSRKIRESQDEGKKVKSQRVAPDATDDQVPFTEETKTKRRSKDKGRPGEDAVPAREKRSKKAEKADETVTHRKGDTVSQKEDKEQRFKAVADRRKVIKDKVESLKCERKKEEERKRMEDDSSEDESSSSSTETVQEVVTPKNSVEQATVVETVKPQEKSPKKQSHRPTLCAHIKRVFGQKSRRTCNSDKETAGESIPVPKERLKQIQVETIMNDETPVDAAGEVVRTETASYTVKEFREHVKKMAKKAKDQEDFDINFELFCLRSQNKELKFKYQRCRRINQALTAESVSLQGEVDGLEKEVSQLKDQVHVLRANGDTVALVNTPPQTRALPQNRSDPCASYQHTNSNTPVYPGLQNQLVNGTVNSLVNEVRMLKTQVLSQQQQLEEHKRATSEKKQTQDEQGSKQSVGAGAKRKKGKKSKKDLKVGWFPATHVKYLSENSGRAQFEVGPANLGACASDAGQNRMSRPFTVVTANAPASLDHVVALYSYVGQKEEELTFKKGSLIHVLNKDCSNWWKGEIDGVQGVFPSNLVSSSSSEALMDGAVE